MAYNNIHLPVGYDFDVQTTPGVDGVWTSLGVTMDDGALELSYDVSPQTGSKAEDLINAIRNQQVTVSVTLAQIELSNIHKLMSGATAYTSVAGTPVVQTDTYTIAAWQAAKFIPFAHQNGAGTVPASISAESPASTTLTLGADYYIIQDAQGRWGIQLVDTVPVDPATNALEVNYTYTPSASRKLTIGSSSVAVVPRAFRIRKLLAAGKYFTIQIHSAINSNGLSLTFPRSDAEEIPTLPITITGRVDVTRTDLDQLLSIDDQYGIIDN